MKIAIIIGGYNPGHDRTVEFIAQNKKSTDIFVLDLKNSNLDDLNLYNIIIVHTSLESATKTQLLNLCSFLRIKNKILFLIHESSIYNRKYTFFNELVGVRFKGHFANNNFYIEKKCDHFLLNGVKSIFQVEDELYFFEEDISAIENKSNVLLSELNTGIPVLFEKEIKKSNSLLYYISIGHDKNTLDICSFKKIIENLFSLAYQIENEDYI